MTERKSRIERLQHYWEARNPIEKAAYVVGAVVGLFLLTLIFALIIGLGFGETDSIADSIAIVRDLFLILLALQAMLMSIALIVVMLQLATLINLIQNELQPIVKNMQDAAQTMKGTTEFLSEQLATPVIEGRAMFAGLGAFFREVRGIRKSTQKKTSSKDAHTTGSTKDTTPDKTDAKDAESTD